MLCYVRFCHVLLFSCSALSWSVVEWFVMSYSTKVRCSVILMLCSGCSVMCYVLLCCTLCSVMFCCGMLCDDMLCSVMSCSAILVFCSVMLCWVMLCHVVFVEGALFCYVDVLFWIFCDVICSVMLCSMLCHVLLWNVMGYYGLFDSVMFCHSRVLFCHALLSDVVLCRIR